MTRDWTREYFGITDDTSVSDIEKENKALQEKLDIAVKALEFYANSNTWDCCAKCQCAYVDGSTAHIALEKIKEIK